MRRVFLALAALSLCAPIASAQSSRLTGFRVLLVEPSARAAALAGSYNAIADGDVNVLFYNPALLTDEAAGALSVGYLNHLSDLSAGFVSYARSVAGVGTVGAGLRYLSYGEFEETDAEGETLGTFGAREAVLTVSVGRALSERFSVGGSVHGLYSGVADASASAVAFDAGAAYHIPSQQLTLAASVHNVGVVTSSLGGTRDELPADLRISASKRLANVPLLLTVTGYDLTSFEGETSAAQEVLRHLVIGGEFQLGSALRLRAGYDKRRHDDFATAERLDLAGASMGFGLNLRRFGFDYAYNSLSSFGGLHHLTVRARL